jgi:molybdate transport system permease protein
MLAADLWTLALTVAAASTATALILPPGVALAWLLATREFRGRALLETLVSLPLVLPPTAVGLLLLLLLQPVGPLGHVLTAIGVPILFTPAAVVLSAAVMALPLLVRTARSGFEALDPRLLAVARTLGRGPWHVFLRVALPLTWRPLAAGVLLAFARALGEFGATILVAGNIPGRTQTAALAIFQYLQQGDDAHAARLGGAMAVVAFVIVLGTSTLERRRERRLST